jgi:predicted Zn-dependent protease
MGAAQAAPYLPSDGGQVLQAVPKRSDPQQQRLLVLKAQLKADPRDVGVAAALAQAYIAAGRRDADPRFYGYAQAALAPWWQAATVPGEIRLLRATLRQATHQFGPAMDDLQALVREQPENAQAWLTLATVQSVTGDYRAAQESCSRLSGLAPAAVMSACLANPYAATGRAAEAAGMLKAHEHAAIGDPATRAWLAGMQGELAARMGDYQAAQRYYRLALDTDPGDSYVLGAYADMLLDQGRHREVADLLKAHDRIDALLLRRALALQALGSDRDALGRAVAELDARFAAAARRGDAVHEREQARYLLHLKRDPVRALALARHNWQVQKEVPDARILLEAAAAAQQAGAGQPVRDWIRANRVQDVVLERLAKRAGGQA